MDNIKIRPLTPLDNDAFFKMVSDDQIAQDAGFMNVLTKTESADYLLNVIRNQQALAIVVNNNVAGVILLAEQVSIDGMPDDQHLELAFMVQRSFQHRGIMTNALKKLLNNLLITGKVDTLVANVKDTNVASKRVLMRAGFVQVGTFNDFDQHSICQFEIRIDK